MNIAEFSLNKENTRHRNAACRRKNYDSYNIAANYRFDYSARVLGRPGGKIFPSGGGVLIEGANGMKWKDIKAVLS